MKQKLLYFLLVCVVLALLSLDREARQCLDCGIHSRHKVFCFAGLELFETSVYESTAVSRFLDPENKCSHDRKQITLGRRYYALFLDPGRDYAYLRHNVSPTLSDDAAFYDFLELSQKQSSDFRELVRFAVSDRALSFPGGSEERRLASFLPDYIKNEFYIYKEDPVNYRNPFSAEAGKAAETPSRLDYLDVYQFFRSGMSTETTSPGSSPQQQ